MPALDIAALDTPGFDAAEVAAIASLNVKTVANWTDRGFVNPYQGPWEWKRGRGQARRYSLRDMYRFALMADLAARYQLPLPLGKQICSSAFGEAFAIGNAGFLVVEAVKATFVTTRWCRDGDDLAAFLAQRRLHSALVLNTKLTVEAVNQKAQTLPVRERRQMQ